MRRIASIFFASFAVMAVVACSQSDATHKVLAWDANTETDMKEYRVYQCSTTPCAASGTPFAVIAQSVVTPKPTKYTTPIPDTDKFYVVYAVDTSDNVSSPSATVAANLLPPNIVQNVRVE